MVCSLDTAKGMGDNPEDSKIVLKQFARTVRYNIAADIRKEISDPMWLNGIINDQDTAAPLCAEMAA
jgi:hypothetical protein